ncbi:SCO4225 family membrane protein [Streptomyces sp. URMC 125]|uniref:SCO4225 family membrane protein n=1 Tax=Streptomyces sp. URMC 125 TaxID=3423419 RepID=UPI003F1BB55E
MTGRDDAGAVRRALTRVADNPAARLYLAVCAALLGWAVVDTAFVQHDDASMAGVWPFAATLPTGLLVLAVPLPDNRAGAVLLLALPAVAALVNAWAISAVLRRLRARATRA